MRTQACARRCYDCERSRISGR